MAVVPHAYTHFRITLHAFDCTLVAGEPRAIEVADVRWTTLDAVDQFAMAVTDQQIVAALKARQRTDDRGPRTEDRGRRTDY